MKCRQVITFCVFLQDMRNGKCNGSQVRPAIDREKASKKGPILWSTRDFLKLSLSVEGLDDDGLRPFHLAW